MKRNFLMVFLVAITAICLSVGISACNEIYSNNLEYTLSDGGSSYTVSGIGECGDEDIIIPSKYNGLPVTVIGEGAFSGTLIKSITIPDSVISIEDYAFYCCFSLESVIIPDSVTTLGALAFCDCSALQNITIGNNITSIGSEAFDNTAYYDDINNWDDKVLYIGSYLLVADDDISGGYSIKDGTTVVAGSAFYYCESLSSVIIPDSVITIGNDAFDGCKSLISIAIGRNVTSIGSEAFKYTGYYYDETNWKDDVLYIGDYLVMAKISISGTYSLKEGTSVVASYAFGRCSSLTSVTV